MTEINLERIKKAQERLADITLKTPLIRSEHLSKFSNNNVYLKLENLQKTNSFKVRGAFNRMSLLTAKEKTLGVIAASSGNHAQGVALAAEYLKISATLLVPLNISINKLEKLKKYNVTIIQRGDFTTMEPEARDLSLKENLTYISPYNDVEIIAGQGTIALEIFEELSQIDYIIVPIGGGGLISGIAIAAKAINPGVEIIGVQTKGASTMYESWKAGNIIKVDEFNTIAEGLSGGLEEDALTFHLIQSYVDKIVLVKEESIKNAISVLWKKENQVVEGAGATVVAFILENTLNFTNKNVVAVISGGNIENSLFQKIIRST
ncbi:MAG: threonine ammonia-lyase [Promethearchaeota archaeon]|jgi:threonine dehydratase